MISDADWPALATKLPESNAVTTENDPTKTGADMKIQCFKCKQFGQKANNPIRPLFTPKKNDSPSGGPKMRPKDPWKYIEPHNLTMPVEIEGKKWYYCTKCKCRATGKVGFYQLSHTDATHDPNYKPEGNLTPVEDPDPTPPPPLAQPIDENVELHDDLVFTGVNCAPVALLYPSRNKRENVDFNVHELVELGEIPNLGETNNT